MKNITIYLFLTTLCFFSSSFTITQKSPHLKSDLVIDNITKTLHITQMSENLTITIFISGGDKKTYQFSGKDFKLPVLPNGTHLIHVNDGNGKMSTITFNNTI